MNPAASGAFRLASTVTGTLLLLVAARLGRRRPAPSSVSVDAPPPWLGALVRRAAAVCTRFSLLQRRGDDALPVHIALAPRTWPSRVLGAAAACRPSPPSSSRPAAEGAAVDLARLMSGLRLVAATIAAVAASCVALVCLGLRLAPVAAAAISIPPLAAAATRLPDVALHRAARAALSAAERCCAPALDILGAAFAAGLAARDALELTAIHTEPAVAAALRAASLRLATGDDPRTAFTAEAERFRLPVLRDIGDALDRSRRTGTPVSDDLHRLAARQRASDRARLLEHAARRGPLATVIVAAVIAPVCLAALVACVVAGLLQGGGLGLT